MSPCRCDMMPRSAKVHIFSTDYQAHGFLKSPIQIENTIIYLTINHTPLTKANPRLLFPYFFLFHNGGLSVSYACVNTARVYNSVLLFSWFKHLLLLHMIALNIVKSFNIIMSPEKKILFLPIRLCEGKGRAVKMKQASKRSEGFVHKYLLSAAAASVAETGMVEYNDLVKQTSIHLKFVLYFCGSNVTLI